MSEAYYSYTPTLLTNGQVLLTAGIGNVEVGKELYDPTTGQWKALKRREIILPSTSKS